MTTDAYINIAIQTFSGLLSLMLILFLIFARRHKSHLEKLYIWFLSANFCALVSNVVSWIFDGSDALGRVCIYIIQFAPFLFYYLLMPIFTAYIAVFIGERGADCAKPKKIVYCITGAAIVFLVISQFNGMFYYIDRNFLYHRGNLFWLSQAFGLAALSVDLYIVIRHRKILQKIEFFMFTALIILPFVSLVVHAFVYASVYLFVATTLISISIYIFIQSEKDIEFERSRTAVMLSQIQPHFLYNTLTSIRALCADDPEKAAQAIGDFSEFLRGNMDSISALKPISFDKEFKHLMHYLEIEKMRFEDRLTITTDIRATGFSLPTLTLQPIAENAIKHGISKKKNGGTIHISTCEKENHFEISISDNGTGFDISELDDISQIGINNVKKRLAMQCGGTLDIESEKGRGTTVVIKIHNHRR